MSADQQAAYLEQPPSQPAEAAQPLTVRAGDQTFEVLQQIDVGQITKVWQVKLADGTLAALRKPKPNVSNAGELLQDEAWQLGRFTRSTRSYEEPEKDWDKKEKPHQILIPRLLEDGSKDPKDPYLLVRWAPGKKLPDCQEFKDLPPEEAITFAGNLAKFTQHMFLYHIIMTDGLKAGSMNYDPETGHLWVFDWNKTGTKPEDLPEAAMPILGQTLYRFYTGELLEFSREVKGFRINPNHLKGNRWQALPISIKSFLYDLLERPGALGVYTPGASKADINHNILSGAVKSQERIRQQFWQEAEELLAQAKTAQGLEAIAAFDMLAWGKNRELTPQEQELYKEAVLSVTASLLDLKKFPLKTGLGSNWESEKKGVFFNWALRKFPQDRFTRWAWLINRIPSSEFRDPIIQSLTAGETPFVKETIVDLSPRITLDESQLPRVGLEVTQQAEEWLKAGKRLPPELLVIVHELAYLTAPESGTPTLEKVKNYWQLVAQAADFRYDEKELLSQWLAKLPEEKSVEEPEERKALETVVPVSPESQREKVEKLLPAWKCPVLQEVISDILRIDAISDQLSESDLKKIIETILNLASEARNKAAQGL